MNNTKRASAWAIGVLMASLPGAVMAQQATATTPEPAPSAFSLDAHGNRVFRSPDEIIVHGDVQRPYAFSLTGRSPLGYQYTDDRRSFVQSAVEAVRRTPF